MKNKTTDSNLTQNPNEYARPRPSINATKLTVEEVYRRFLPAAFAHARGLLLDGTKFDHVMRLPGTRNLTLVSTKLCVSADIDPQLLEGYRIWSIGQQQPWSEGTHKIRTEEFGRVLQRWADLRLDTPRELDSEEVDSSLANRPA